MDQPRISSFWRKRRRSSIKSKRRLSPERSARLQDPCSQTPPTSQWDFVLPEEKNWKGVQGYSKRPNRSLTTSSPTSDSVLESVIDDFRPRTSGSKRHQVSLSPTGSFHEVDQSSPRRNSKPSTNPRIENSSPSHSKSSRWLRRCVSATFRHSCRPSLSFQSHGDASYHIEALTSPIPGIGIEPPIIPDNLTSGAAARAAAATQNEILECVRNLRLTEPKIRRDSESGIGIEMRERGEESNDIPIPRKDPFDVLPEELVVLILSYLDDASLIEAELVSRRWYESASSHHIWKHVFRKEFEHGQQSTSAQTGQLHVGGPGLGKIVPDQDWKSMWRARKALDQRWRDGHAAAIYLEGHTDCVYCVQFDEHKILTGSRDRTIRVWDAHTYECIEVLGVHCLNSTLTVNPLPTNMTSRGHRPFTKFISPQTTPAPTASASDLYHGGSILCLQYNAFMMVTGSSDCTCIVWDLTDGYRPVGRLRHHTAGVLDVCFDSKYIVSCSKDTTVCLWDQATGELLRKLSGHRGPVNAVQLRGNLVVSASGDGVARLWNLTSGLCIKEFRSKDRGMACVEFSPDSRTILAGGNDQVIYQFDTTTGELVRELTGHRNLVRSLHLDSANGRIVSGSYDHSVKAYDFSTGENIVDFVGWTTSWILSAKADYRRIVATSQDSRAVVMDFGYGLKGAELLEGG